MQWYGTERISCRRHLVNITSRMLCLFIVWPISHIILYINTHGGSGQESYCWHVSKFLIWYQHQVLCGNGAESNNFIPI